MEPTTDTEGRIDVDGKLTYFQAIIIATIALAIGTGSVVVGSTSA
jgi:hypothetical protein